MSLDGHQWHLYTRGRTDNRRTLWEEIFQVNCFESLQRTRSIVHAFSTRPLKSHYPFIIVDAIYLKMREGHQVKLTGLLVAVDINEEGYRELIDFQVTNTETETSLGEFFVSLKERGLKDVDLVTSDNHKGLVKTVRRHFQGTTWQRCKAHFLRNMLDQ